MFAKIVLYGFALPSDLERMRARLLTEHSIQVNECRRDRGVTLANDDSQILCTLYRVPTDTRYNERAATRLLHGARDTILEITMVKTAIVVDSMEDVAPAHLQRDALTV